MPYMRMYFKVQDTTGYNFAKCINVLGKIRKKRFKLGDVITLAPIKHKKLRLVLKLSVYKGMICGVCYWILRKAGYFFTFNANLVFLLKDLETAFSTKVRGPLPIELFLRSRFLPNLIFHFYV